MQTEISNDLAQTLEAKGQALAETLNRAIASIEAISDVARKFFAAFQQQKESVMELGHQASDTLRPVAATSMKVIGQGIKSGENLVRKGRENPTPFIIGGVAVLGGLAILAYYLNKSEENQSAGREAERERQLSRTA